jgi:hypothetical protein
MKASDKFTVGQLVRTLGSNSYFDKGDILRVCGVGVHVDVETLDGKWVGEPDWPRGGRSFFMAEFEPLSK